MGPTQHTQEPTDWTKHRRGLGRERLWGLFWKNRSGVWSSR